MTTWSPSAIGWSPRWVSAVAVRRKVSTGDAQRTISSTRRAGSCSGSLRRSSHWSGCWAKAITPWEMELRVVSLPATPSSTTNAPISSSVRPLPVDLGLDEAGEQVVAGIGAALGGDLRAEHAHGDAGGEHLGERIVHRGEELGILGADHEVGGVAQLGPSLVGHAEHLRDRPEREPDRRGR